MNIDYRVKQATALRDSLQAQIKSIEEQSLGLQQRHQELVVQFHRADGSLSALNDVKAESDEEEAAAKKAEASLPVAG